MPWKTTTPMMMRQEFVQLVMNDACNMSEVCHRYGISRKTGYKWVQRCHSDTPEWYLDQSRRPLHMPFKISEKIEKAILAVRDEHPAWGGRKIRVCLEADGWTSLPAASTITAVLHRHGLISPEESAKRGPMKRFEREQPNELWQMDFKGPFQTTSGQCNPLTIVDDHSRFAVCVTACPDQREISVRKALTEVFQVYGLPLRMLMDNGTCWKNTDSPYTILTVWLLRLGIGLSHGRPYHPQTQGKNERFNKTLKAEAIRGHLYGGLEDCQRAFDQFRNLLQPEEAS